MWLNVKKKIASLKRMCVGVEKGLAGVTKILFMLLKIATAINPYSSYMTSVLWTQLFVTFWGQYNIISMYFEGKITAFIIKAYVCV